MYPHERSLPSSPCPPPVVTGGSDEAVLKPKLIHAAIAIASVPTSLVPADPQKILIGKAAVL